MKKLVAVSFAFVIALMLSTDVFARQGEKKEVDITFEDLNLMNYAYTSGEYSGLEGELVFSTLQSKVAVAESSVLADEVANTVMDNSGNYTFFQKQGSGAGDVEDRAGATMYIKGFGGMEKLDMKDYTKFDTTYYGAIVGLDWDRQYSDNFDATYGLFLSYVGSELKEEDFEYDKISANSGFAGVRGNWYIGKLFFGAVLDYGYMANKTEYPVMNVSEDYNVQSIGLSAKAGYNFEVAEKSFTIQPNVVFNSNYLITEEYDVFTAMVGEMKVKSDDILNMAVAPGLKLAKTLGKCWILSAEGKYVFVSSDGDIKLDSNSYIGTLPDTYYKDYASCGIGIEKIWGYTVLHVKGNKTFGGRDGFVVNAGIEFKF
jgi:outer membrane autotransporter protein